MFGTSQFFSSPMPTEYSHLCSASNSTMLPPFFSFTLAGFDSCLGRHHALAVRGEVDAMLCEKRRRRGTSTYYGRRKKKEIE